MGAQLGAGPAGERLQASRPARGEASGCRGVARGERGEGAGFASSAGSRRPPSSSGPPALGSVVPERSLRLACSRTARVSGADPTRGEPPGSASCCTEDRVRGACGACSAACPEAQGKTGCLAERHWAGSVCETCCDGHSAAPGACLP